MVVKDSSKVDHPTDVEKQVPEFQDRIQARDSPFSADSNPDVKAHAEEPVASWRSPMPLPGESQ